MEQEESFQKLKSKSLSSIGSLIYRQFATKTIFFLANVILARLLVPETFGIYAIVSFVMQFFTIFGDVGIGAALIQKKESLSEEELSSIFWLQQILVWVVVMLVFLFAPLAVRFYPNLPAESVWLIRALAIGFMLTSLKTLPAVLMERNIEFNRIAWVDITESLSFHLTAIILAYAGFEVWSFILAAIVRSLLSVVVTYALSAWRPTCQFHYAAIKELLRFGLPYQGNNILAFIKDAVTPLFVGAYAGASAVGYVNWAKNFSFAPLMISETFGRVAFPAFSRIQNDRELLGRTVERSIRMMTLVMFPMVALMIALGPEITRVVFTPKWLPGVTAFYFYCTSPLAIGIMLPMYSAILALGKSEIVLKMMAVLLLLEWGMGVPFVLNFGFSGIAFSQPIISTTFFFVYRRVLVREGVRVEILANVRSQLGIAVVAGFLAKGIILAAGESLLNLAGTFAAGGLVFIGLMFLVQRSLLVEFRDYLLKVMGKHEVAV